MEARPRRDRIYVRENDTDREHNRCPGHGVTPDGETFPTVTHTYIFIDDVLAQPVNPPGFPDTWGVYSGDSPGLPAGSPVIADYEMDPDIVHDPEYGPLLADALLSLPTLSLVTDVDNLDIYANPEMRGPEWERPVSVEFWPADDPDLASRSMPASASRVVLPDGNM